MASTTGAKKLAQTAATTATATTTTTTNKIVEQLLKVAPWNITGPASDPEWQNVPVKADQYRSKAPVSFYSQPDQVKIPNAEADRIFNVRYYPRDARRAFEPVLHGKDSVVSIKTISNKMTSEELDEILGMKLTNVDDHTKFFPGKRDRSQDYHHKSSGYRAVPLLENPGGGYT